MKRFCTVVAAVVTGAALLVSGPARAADAAGFAVRPLPGPVTREYDAPEPDWKPGHRGVDLAGLPSDDVHAAAAGTVSFAGSVAGTPVVVITHGDLRTTYEPVQATVAVGTQVRPGDVVGTLLPGHPGCTAAACLHWGLKEGERYRAPRSLLPAGGSVRLVASAAPPPPPPAAPGPGHGPLRRPPGPVTSGFGMRVHPVTGDYILHDGTDFGLACGTPITAAADGVVTRAGEYGGFGLTVEIDHGMIDGHHVTTLYAHASGFSTQVGARVRAGETVAAIGSTGYSTGCHLHFGVYADGKPVDPLQHTA